MPRLPRSRLAPADRSAGSTIEGGYHPGMRTVRIRVADGVDLAVDSWTPARAAASSAGPGPAPAGDVPAPVAFVLVHGLASNARMWDGVAQALGSCGHAAVSVDLRGHGRSAKPDGPYDMATVADDLGAVISALHLDRPVVAGQSWGGNVAIELAARHPGTVRGLVCVDGGWLEPSAHFEDWEACRAALAPPRLAGQPAADIEARLRAAHPDWPEAGIRGALANFEVRADGTVAPWLSYDHHLQVLRGLWDHHPSRLYARLAAPVLLVPADGGTDPHWADRKRRDVDLALAALPRARVAWLDGDHDLHAQHPAELADVMVRTAGDGLFG